MTDTQAQKMDQPRPTISPTTYVVIYVVLMLLLGATVGITYLDVGPFNLIIALGIAVVKALLVTLYFMHVRQSSRLTWIVAASAYVWLGILFVLGLSDYVTRGSFPVFGQ